MPFTGHEGAKLYWDAAGSGEPLLLIMGLGYTSDMWFRVRPALEDRFRLIWFDNRGVGRSSVPPAPESRATSSARGSTAGRPRTSSGSRWAA